MTPPIVNQPVACEPLMSEPRSPKKSYRPPTLTDYGTLLDLTLAVSTIGRADRIGPRPNRLSR